MALERDLEIVFRAFLETLMRLLRRCCGYLIKFPQMLKVFTLYT